MEILFAFAIHAKEVSSRRRRLQLQRLVFCVAMAASVFGIFSGYRTKRVGVGVWLWV